MGINELACNVAYAHGGGGKSAWNAYVKPEKELEAALASLIRAPVKAVSGGEERGSKADELQQAIETDSRISRSEDVIAAIKASVAEDVAIERDEGQSVPEVEDTLVLPVRPSDVLHGSAGRNELSLAEVNQDLVMRCLADATTTSSDLVISVFDFGGQSVFNVIHHLFLTKNGVYTLTFNMEWLLEEGPAREQCLAYLKFWLNSIVVHTLDTKSGLTAPLALVGTRKDLVDKPSDHEKISVLLFEIFSRSKAWSRVLPNTRGVGKNGTATLWFYPVDNTKGREDIALTQLTSEIENAMDSGPYTHKKVPLTWFRMVDSLQGGKSWFDLQEVADIGARCGISQSDELKYMLMFLHEMGILFWTDEPGLGEVVIMDAVRFLVEPATTIICKHVPVAGDPTQHVRGVHRECSQRYYNEWFQLTETGVLSSVLVPILWRDYADHTSILLKFMVKFGLLVPLDADINSGNTSSGDAKYLVPALLPAVDLASSDIANWSDEVYKTCFFVFTTFLEFCSMSAISSEDLNNFGFLPSGLFERIIGKAIAWCQKTSKAGLFHINNVCLYQNVAIMSFGNQRFRLMLCPGSSTIRLDVEGKNPLPVHNGLIGIVSEVIQECMKSLRCFSALLNCGNTVSPTASQVNEFSYGNTSSGLLVPLESLSKAFSEGVGLAKTGGRKFLSNSDIRDLYGDWLQLFGMRDIYDVFISYRWGQHDSPFVSTVFDMFTNYTIGSDNRAIEVFLDTKRLLNGRRFDKDFANSLVRSTVIMPIVSADALDRLLKHNADNIDNLLVEWIVSLACYADEKARTKSVFPVLFGARSVDGVSGEVTVQNLFSSGIVDSIPDITPTATLRFAEEILLDQGISFAKEKFFSQTLKSITNEMLKYLSCLSWKLPSHRVVESAVSSALEVLRSHVSDHSAPVVEIVPNTVEHPSQSTSVTTQEVEMNHQDVWAIIHNEKYVTDLEAMRKCLQEDLGIYDATELIDLDKEEVVSISSYLKTVHKKKLLKCSRIC